MPTLRLITRHREPGRHGVAQRRAATAKTVKDLVGHLLTLNVLLVDFRPRHHEQ
ncbi:hypothetical protein [Streptomyces sp. NPDC055055]